MGGDIPSSRCTTCVFDTGGKWRKKIGVVDTGGNLPPVNDPNVIFRGLGKDDARKT
jgi:hypothetical protein